MEERRVHFRLQDVDGEQEYDDGLVLGWDIPSPPQLGALHTLIHTTVGRELRLVGFCEPVAYPVVHPLTLLLRYPEAIARASSPTQPLILRTSTNLSLAPLPTPLLTLAELEEGDERTAEEGRRKLVEGLRDRGYVLLRWGEKEAGAVKSAAENAERFFDLDMRSKFECARQDMVEGYGFMKRGRETYNAQEVFVEYGPELLDSDSDSDSDFEDDPVGKLPLPYPPSLSPEFPQAITTAVSSLKRVATLLLKECLADAGVSADAVESMVAIPETVHASHRFRTTLRLLKYHKDVAASFQTEKPSRAGSDDGSEDSSAYEPEIEDGEAITLDELGVMAGDALCMEHGDSTLLTIAPVSSVPELQVVDAATGQWINAELLHTAFEEESGTGTHWEYGVVFPGYFLARASSGRFRATLHRVELSHPDTDRISLPFFLRTEPEIPLCLCPSLPLSPLAPLAESETKTLDALAAADSAAAFSYYWMPAFPLWTKFKPTPPESLTTG